MRVLSLFLIITLCLSSVPVQSQPYTGHPMLYEPSPEIGCMLVSGEQVLWEGKPSATPLSAELLGSFFPAVVSILIKQFAPESISQDNRKIVMFCGILMSGAWAVSAILRLLDALRAKYAITNKRIIIKSGLLESIVQLIPFNKIKKIELKQGLLASLFGAGSIYIDTGETRTYDVVQKNEKVKTIKNRHGEEMKLDTIEEEKGPDIISQRTVKVYHILQSLIGYESVYRILQRAWWDSKKN